MIVEGGLVSGLGIRTTHSLSSIGNMLFWYDYRKGITVANDGTNDRVVQLDDLGPLGINLSNNGTIVRSPVLVSDGITGLSGSTRVLKSLIRFDQLDILHKGNAFLTFSVYKYNNPTDFNGGIIYFYRTFITASKPGQVFRVATSVDQLQSVVFNDSGVSLGQQTKVVTEDSTFRVAVCLYYGSGITNNRKLILADSVTQVSFNPSFGSDPYGEFAAFEIPGGSASFITIKTIGGYDLTGKSESEINTFLSIFYQTLKSDPEYASLLTP